MHLVIVGNGVAGIEAAIGVRARQPDWEITIISEESDHFFSRTALMWVHTGQLRHQDIEPHERDLYARMGFTRVRGRAVGVDTDAREVQMAAELEPIPYDRLLIACGSRPRPGPWPGSDRVGVGHFVTLQDLEWLEREAHGGPSRGGRPPRPDHHVANSPESSPYRARPVARERRGRGPLAPAVIGGGLIGIEAVEVLAAAGLEPRFLIREEWFWPMAIDARESAWITERMRGHGIDVRLEENVERLEGEGDLLERMVTDKDELDCDLCVIAIGVIPNTAWLEGSAIERDRRGGIVVDRALMTSVDGVFAAGDCASVEWFNGVAMPQALWYTSRDQGRIAAKSILGDVASYARGLWYNSAKLMDIEYTTAGLVNMRVEDERNWFFEERGAVRSTNRIVLSGENVVGFNFLGRRWDHTVLLRWIREHRSLEYVLEHLREASFDTELVPPLQFPKRQQPGGPAPSGMPNEVSPPRMAR